VGLRLRPVARHAAVAHESSVWYRLGRSIMRRPYAFFGVSVVILVALSIPTFGMRLGTADAGNHPTSTTTRRAYDLVAGAFGAGMNGPLQVVVEVARERLGDDAPQLARIAPEIREHLRGLPEAADTSEFALFEAMRTFVHRLAEAQSLVLVLDDLRRCRPRSSRPSRRNGSRDAGPRCLASRRGRRSGRPGRRWSARCG